MPTLRGGRSKVSAGLLLFRRTPDLEIFIAHPGGPFWKNRDLGAWTIPKGEPNAGEDLLTAAKREFREETGFDSNGPYLPLGSIRQKAGKEVHAWAWEGDLDPTQIRSNLTRTEVPRRSGEWIEFPEIDRCAWKSPSEARRHLNPAQAAFVDRLIEVLRG